MRIDKIAQLLSKMTDNPGHRWAGWLVIPEGSEQAAQDFREAGFDVKLIRNDVIVGQDQPS